MTATVASVCITLTWVITAQETVMHSSFEAGQSNPALLLEVLLLMQFMLLQPRACTHLRSD